MTQILEAIGLALNSVWANKLRSFMMVLGNIVAVTSIIAVVSLIQGMNAYVSDAIIKDVGVGTFKIDKIGFITNEEEERRAWRRNPDVTTLDMKAVEEFSPVIRAVMAEAGSRANVVYKDELLENTRVRGVSQPTTSSAATRPSSGGCQPDGDPARPAGGSARLGDRR